jgi:CheY-like chemotaxis protein
MDRADIDQWKARDVARLIALLETERRYYQEILASIPTGAAIISRTLTVISANRAFRRLVGLKLDEFQNKTLAQILPSAELEAASGELLRTGGSRSNLPVTVAGRRYRVSLASIGSGEPEAEREVLVALEEDGGMHSAFAGSRLADIPALLWTMNPATLSFETVEGASDLLLGYSEQHWLHTPGFWLERVRSEDRSAVDEFYRSAIRQGGEFACEFRAVTAAGQSLWYRDSFRVLRDANGVAVRICGLSTNVTARRLAEADNVQANRVDALTGLSRSLVREFNNSLMIVTGYSEELLAGLPDHDIRKADVQAILAAAETMAGTAGELNGFTRRQSSPPGVIDVIALLTSVGARIRQELGATLVLRLPPERLTALSDPTQFEAAVMAIARRLRDKLDPHMIIVAREKRINDLSNLELAVKPGHYVEIVFRGPYPAAAPQSVFESLVSGKDPHSSDLARTYAIVREWGGTMFAGRTDQSSEIRMLLPALVEQKASPEVRLNADASTPEAISKAPEREAGGPSTVLVVEDEVGIRSLVRKILLREGYTVVDASTPDEALEAARLHPVDLLITDVALRAKSGRELADRLLTMYPNLRTLYISGYTDDPDKVARNIGTTGPHLQKPFTLTALVRKVRQVLNPGVEMPAVAIGRAVATGTAPAVHGSL